jgi:DNA repair exonuclease SbcCD ATPase subunit
MKNIIFNNIKIQNFLSIGHSPIELCFKTGITLITGENKDTGGKNGIGKSTISDAIFWVLFGNTIRELKKDKIQHNKNKNECKVILNFSIQTEKDTKNYKIVRTLDPSKVELYCDDSDITPSTIAKSDEYIKLLIGANEEVFSNVVIMSADNTLPFMAQKKVDKRKFIEGILQLNIFSEMLLKTRSDYNETKKENDFLSNDFINHQKNLELFEKQKENGELVKQQKIKSIQDKIKINENTLQELKIECVFDIDDIKKQILQLESKIKVLESGKKQIDQNKTKKVNERATFLAEIQQLKKEKQNFIDKGDKCPSCNRLYCDEDINSVKTKISSIDEQITESIKTFESIKIEINDLDDKTSNISDGITKIKEKIKKLVDELTKSSLLNQKIKHLNDKNHEYLIDINDINVEKQDYDENINETKKKILDVEKNLNIIKQKIQILDSVKFIVSEEGVKTYIVKKMIDTLNTRLNFYLNALDAPCKFVFDEFFEETIYNKNGTECSYYNFSGGERKRIDVAILFMFQDLLKLQSNISFSLNIYDELFDSALDEVGVDKILNILKQKVEKYQETIYIISHKNNTRNSVDSVINLEKINGETRIAA